MILGILGSNPRLRDRELKIDAARPFRRWSPTATSVELRAFLHNVRTFSADKASEKILEEIRSVMETDKDGQEAAEEAKAA
jgi:hypothetical protein